MIKLTYEYNRDVFKGKDFTSWVKNFNTARFDGFEYGRRRPTLTIGVSEFIEKQKYIPYKNLVSIEGIFNILEYLAYKVLDFKVSIENGTAHNLNEQACLFFESIGFKTTKEKGSRFRKILI